MKKNNWKYKITGASSQSVLVSFAALAVFGGVSLWLHISGNGAYIFTDIFTLFVLVIALYTLYCRLFKKLLISDEGFCLQTSPANGKYYSYSDAAKAWISSGATFSGLPSGFYFNFKTVDGEEFRFSYQNYQSDEIELLLLRINGTDADN